MYLISDYRACQIKKVFSSFVCSIDQMVSQIIFAVKFQCVSNNQPHTHHFKKFCVSAEISFLFGGRQLAMVSALTTCSLFSLSLQDFQEIEKEFPHVVNELRAAAQQLKNDLESKSHIISCFDIQDKILISVMLHVYK